MGPTDGRAVGAGEGAPVSVVGAGEAKGAGLGAKVGRRVAVGRIVGSGVGAGVGPREGSGRSAAQLRWSNGWKAARESPNTDTHWVKRRVQ